MKSDLLRKLGVAFDAEKVGREVVAALEAAGLREVWNCDPRRAIQVPAQ